MAEMLKNTTYEQDNLIIEKKRVETVVVATGEGMSFFVKADCEETQLVRIIGESRMRTDKVRIS